jgi:hypothetical protein
MERNRTVKQTVKTVTAGLAAIVALGGTVMAQTAAAPAAAPAAKPAEVKKTWADSVTVKGSLRYRYETIDDDSKKNADKETFTRQRDRYRAMLSVEGKVNDNTKAGIEFSTGQADPVSGNQTLGGGFDKEDFKLNRAYIDYSFLGDNPNKVNLIGGKMKNPFITYSDDLVWDGDLTPEGLALKALLGEGMLKFMLNGGYMQVEERSSQDDLRLVAAQGAVQIEFSPEATLTFGASSYTFQNMATYNVVDWEKANSSYGNSTQNGTVSGSTTNKAWKYEYEPVVFFADLDLFVMEMPVKLFAQSLSNGEVDDYDSGTMYGITIGKAKNLNTWEIGYSYAEVEKDATVGMFTDSDRWGGGTDGEGSRVYAKYQIQKNLQLGATFLMGEKKISDASKTTDYERMQIDIAASF